MKDQERDTFFVGYLDMPAALRRFYTPLTILLLGVSGLIGFGIASMQSSTGAASWQTESSETLSGLLMVDPYPVLHRLDPANPDQVESILLVNQGKFSAEAYARPYHNRMVSVTGFPITRGGWTMLEVTAADSIFEDQSGKSAADVEIEKNVTAKSLGVVTLNGEIADSKCFLGVMKPGEGSVHKACAEVCLIGGIPSMLVVRDGDGRKYGYILTLPDGSSASTALSGRAADKVGVTGELMQKGDLIYIKISPDGLRG
ncbi:MAG: hypothetical protein WBM41_01535 [Arenicellales bacterium]